jgi:hypothetical protein
MDLQRLGAMAAVIYLVLTIFHGPSLTGFHMGPPNEAKRFKNHSADFQDFT